MEKKDDIQLTDEGVYPDEDVLKGVMAYSFKD